MKGKFMIIAALLGALTFGACVDTEESSSVKAIRDAKAEQLKSVATLNNAKAQAEATIAAAEAQIAAAQAQLLAAQAAKVQAEAAYQAAQTEAQKIENQKAAAKAEQEIAQAEAEIARIQAQLEIDLLTYQTNLLAAQLNFNKAMQGLAAQEKENLTKIYAAYNAALEDVAELQTSIALKNTEISKVEADIAKLDADKKWEDVVKTANDDVTDLQKKVTDTEASIAAKKAAYANIEAMGGINYAVLKGQIEDALEAKETAAKDVLYAKKNADTKATAFTNNHDAIENSVYAQYFYEIIHSCNSVIGPVIEVSNGVVSVSASNHSPIRMDFGKADLDDEGNVVGWGYKKAERNSDGVYVSTGDIEPIYGPTESDYVQDAYGNDCAELYYTAYNTLFADNLNALADEAALIISTSGWAKDLEVATKKLAAWEKTNKYEKIVEIYNAFLEDKAELEAEKAEKEAKMAANKYLISVYSDTTFADGTKEEYSDEKKELEDENKDLKDDIDDLNDEIDELEDDLEDDLEDMYAETEQEVKDAIDEYKALVAEVERYQKVYDKVLAWEAAKAELNAALIAAYAEVEALLANEATLAQAWHDADEAAAEAGEVAEEADEVYEALLEIWDECAEASADSVQDLMNAELQALDAEIKTLEGTLEIAKSDLEKAQKKAADYAAMTEEEIAEYKEEYLADAIETLEKKIEGYEAEIELLEQQLTVAELDVENWAAILEDALAE